MKKLGFWSSTSLVTGNMIGSGIFLLPATLAIYGSISLIGWLCSSVGALLLALVFRNLGQLQPEALGGPYAYARNALGNFVGFAVAWGYWVSIWCTNAAIAVACVGYLGVFFPFIIETNVASASCGLALIWLFTGVNALGLRQVVWVQRMTTVLKVIPLLLIGFVGAWFVRLEFLLAPPVFEGSLWEAITATTTLSLFAFLGLESASIASSKIKNPAKTMGRASLFGTGFTVFTYILCSIVIMGVLPPEVLANSTAPFADTAEVFWGVSSKYIIAATAVMATLGALNGWILIQGQLPLAAASDRLFPAVFGRTNRHDAPIYGIALSSVLASAVLFLKYSESLVDKFTFMMTLSTLSALIPYLLSAVSLLVMIRSLHNERKVAKGITALLSMIFCVWVIFGCGLDVIVYGSILLLTGLMLYAAKTFYRKTP
jgi:basic amino acid/polyamine antiporter, APA family